MGPCGDGRWCLIRACASANGSGPIGVCALGSVGLGGMGPMRGARSGSRLGLVRSGWLGQRCGAVVGGWCGGWGRWVRRGSDGAGRPNRLGRDGWARDGVGSAALGERAFDRLRVCEGCAAAWWCGVCAAAAGRDWSATWCAVWTRRWCGGHWNRGRCCVQRVRGPHPTWRFAARCGRFCRAAMAVEGRRWGIGMGCGCCAGGEGCGWGCAATADGQQ